MDVIIAQIRYDVLLLGHDVCSGVALVKLIRIHHIFRNPRPNKKVYSANSCSCLLTSRLQAIKDWHLLLGLGILLGVEAVFCAILQTIAITVTNESGEEGNKENPVTINVIQKRAIFIILPSRMIVFVVAGNGCYRGALYHHLW